ncbi:MAG: lipoate--protein ligase family protein [Planctomycetota bacterium]
MRQLVFTSDWPTSSSPALQLAIDEAMLSWSDRQITSQVDAPEDTAWFRWWHFDRHVVVLGRSSRLNDEVHLDRCRQRRIDVLRRCTGGASVVGGPGCGMYSVVVPIENESMRRIDVAHDVVMTKVLAAVQRQHQSASRQGICDLTWRNRKFSGNSLRVSKHHLLYHGTILYDADLDVIADCLAFAPRQPDYRQERFHREFITNLPIDVSKLQSDLADVFAATNAAVIPKSMREQAEQLLVSRYSTQKWTTLR